MGAAFDHVDDLLVFPTAAADEDEADGGAVLGEAAPEVEDEEVVLAGLDGAEEDKVGAVALD